MKRDKIENLNDFLTSLLMQVILPRLSLIFNKVYYNFDCLSLVFLYNILEINLMTILVYRAVFYYCIVLGIYL